jgi:hypothetical protein
VLNYRGSPNIAAADYWELLKRLVVGQPFFFHPTALGLKQCCVADSVNWTI